MIKISMGKNLTTPGTEKPMDMREYMTSYTMVHNFCLYQKTMRKGEFGTKDSNGKGNNPAP